VVRSKITFPQTVPHTLYFPIPYGNNSTNLFTQILVVVKFGSSKCFGLVYAAQMK